MPKRSGIAALIPVLVFALSLAVAAAPLAEPQVNAWQQVARFGGTAVRGAQVFAIGDAAYVVSGMPDSCIPNHEV